MSEEKQFQREIEKAERYLSKKNKKTGTILSANPSWVF
jgi:hypothetical protein